MHIEYVKSENEWKVKYTAHKKFMNSFGCRGYNGVIISTRHCAKTLVYKLAKKVLF